MIGKSFQKWPRKWKRKTKMSNNKANIEKEASKLINDYSNEIGRPIKPPIPVFEMIEFLGYDVDFRKDGLYENHNYLGGLLIDEKIVELNENLSHQEGRMHFTVAHEIGHIVLHANNDIENEEQTNSMCRTTHDSGDHKGDKIEREADAFASYLLMPKREVQDCFLRTRKKPYTFSRLLDVLRLRKYRNKRTKAIRFADKIKRRGGFDNVSKLAFLNRLIELNLIKGIQFQKNFIN